MKKILLLLTAISCTQNYHFKGKHKALRHFCREADTLVVSLDNEIRKKEVNETEIIQMNIAKDKIIRLKAEYSIEMRNLEERLKRQVIFTTSNNSAQKRKINDKYSDKLEYLKPEVEALIYNLEREIRKCQEIAEDRSLLPKKYSSERIIKILNGIIDKKTNLIKQKTEMAIADIQNKKQESMSLRAFFKLINLEMEREQIKRRYRREIMNIEIESAKNIIKLMNELKQTKEWEEIMQNLDNHYARTGKGRS